MDFEYILEVIAIASFAVFGANAAIEHKMDIFGVIVLAAVTAVGGGFIRDLILGITPPNTFRNPVYATVAILTAAIFFMPKVHRLLLAHKHLYDRLMLWMDSLGLGIFTIMGIQTAYTVGGDHSIFLMIFVGVVTGVGGGVLRDVMAGDQPYIFVKHFYASASLAGAFVHIMMQPAWGNTTAMICGTVTVIVLRLMAAKFHWSLPKADI